jgi:hypothetical protein
MRTRTKDPDGFIDGARRERCPLLLALIAIDREARHTRLTLPSSAPVHDAMRDYEHDARPREDFLSRPIQSGARYSLTPLIRTASRGSNSKRYYAADGCRALRLSGAASGAIVL